MKIRMKATLTGTYNGQPWPAYKQTAEVPDSIGAKLCASGLAEPVAEEKPVETATMPTDDVETREKASEKTPARKPRSAGKS